MMSLPPLPVPSDPNPYATHARTLLYESPWIRLREDRFRHRSGIEGRYPVCGFQRTACGVVALDEDDRVALVGQWRYPLERYSWELPEGGGLEHESPWETIRRELAEEAGLEAEVWEPLLLFHTSNSSTDEEAFLFLATSLHTLPSGPAPDAEEELCLHWEPFSGCVARILSGELTDSLTVAGLLALHARREGIQGALAAEVSERFFQTPAAAPAPGRARWAALGEAGQP